MAWTAPMTAVANTAFTAAQFNTYIRDNLLETAPAKASGEGSYFVGNGANTLIERYWGTDPQLAEGSTSSSSYTDLSGSFGPTVTAATSSRALVILTGRMRNNTTSEYAAMSFAVSGDSSIAASDDNCLSFENSAANTDSQASVVIPLNTLTPGSNTFTTKYRSTGGTATFERRRITVLPY